MKRRVQFALIVIATVLASIVLLLVINSARKEAGSSVVVLETAEKEMTQSLQSAGMTLLQRR